jgi:hypothetical protein
LKRSLSISSSSFPSPNFQVSTFNPLIGMAMPTNLAWFWIEPNDIQSIILLKLLKYWAISAWPILDFRNS